MREWLVGLVVALLLALLLVPPARAADSPLEPPGTASPRAALSTLLGSTEAAYATYATRPHDDAAIRTLLDRAAATMDLDAVPPEFREEVGVQTALLLYEVLSRLPLPAIEAVPDETMADQLKLKRWTVPGTPVAIRQLTDGDRAGEFLFETDSVARARAWYERVRDLPKRADRTPTDLFEIYRLGTGPVLSLLLPAGIERWMPAWGGVELLGVPVWKWLGLLAANILGLVVIALAWRLPRLVRRKSAARLVGVPAAAVIMTVPLILDGLALRELRMFGPGLEGAQVAWTVVFFIGAILLAIRLVGLAMQLFRHVALGETRPAVEHLTLLGCRLLQILASLYLVVLMLQQLGVPVSGIVAGLGVSGIAVALAAQHTLSNLIAGLNLLLDRPLKIGDACRFGSSSGTLEFIGLRSSRVRTSERTTINVPNSVLAGMELENLARRDSYLFAPVLAVRRETAPDQLRWLLARLRALLIGHPKVAKDGLSVRLKALSPGALDIAVNAYITTRSNDEWLAVREDLLLRMLEIVAAAGTALAQPAQTLHLARDPGLDPARSSAAATEVARWRAHGNLPFPDFDPGEQGEMTDTLPWPPVGSALRRDHGGG
ncbi:MAG: mechanosensitive ion channel family protein [Geminicoccaceae bacterium]